MEGFLGATQFVPHPDTATGQLHGDVAAVCLASEHDEATLFARPEEEGDVCWLLVKAEGSKTRVCAPKGKGSCHIT